MRSEQGKALTETHAQKFSDGRRDFDFSEMQAVSRADATQDVLLNVGEFRDDLFARLITCRKKTLRGFEFPFRWRLH